MMMLDRIHSETKLSDKPVMELKREKTVSVQKLWDNYLAKHGSLTSRVFEGLQRVSICCTGCQKVDQKCESFSVISLGLGDRETRIEAIFQRNYQPELFKDDSSLYCERCKKKCAASKRTRIIQAPQIMIATLKRFEYDATIGNIRKIEREIEYKESLSLPLQVSEIAVKMELQAVIVGFFN